MADVAVVGGGGGACVVVAEPSEDEDALRCFCPLRMLDMSAVLLLVVA